MIRFYEHAGLAVQAIPKCASESIAAGVPGIRDPMAFERRVAPIRHPIERCVSAYRHLGTSWDVWVDRILAGEIDEHWQPQAQLIADCVNEIWRFEDLTTLLRVHFNQSRPKPVDMYRRAELEQYYAADFALRELNGPQLSLSKYAGIRHQSS